MLFNPLVVNKNLEKHQLISIHESSMIIIKIFINLGKFGSNIKAIRKKRKLVTTLIGYANLMVIFVSLS